MFIQYVKILYLIEITEISGRAIGNYFDIYLYPDESNEVRLNGVVMSYSIDDLLPEIGQGAIVDNNKFGWTLECIKRVQEKRDDTCSPSVPADDRPSRRISKKTGTKSQRSLNQDDMLDELVKFQGRSEEIFSKKR